MNVKSTAELSAFLQKLLTEENCSLFAGAGVSKMANLPIWSEYLLSLAAVAQKYEPLVAALIEKKVKENLLLEAAHYYKTCTDVPAGELLAGLTAPLQSYNALALIPLASLPFEMVVTTNYDRSLHDAFGKTLSATPQGAELRDATLREAPYWKSFFIARIHGRVEVASSIILDSVDYASLSKDTDYADFLHHALTRHKLLFVGFSFLDPAITKILEFIKSQGVFPKLHHAIVPSGNAGLAARMASYNIDVIEYDATAGHKLLWDGIADAAVQLKRKKTAQQVKPAINYSDVARRLLATCYARVCMGNDASALKQIVIQGIVLSEMEMGVSVLPEIAERLRHYLALNDDEARELAELAIADLIDRNICLRDGDTVVVVAKTLKPETSPVCILVDGVLSRALVRERFTVTEELRAALENVIEETIMLRGYDLGASFSGARLDEEAELLPTIEIALDKHLPGYWQARKKLFADLLRNLLRNPDQREESVLGELGRLSFGIELILQSGRTTVYNLSLPQVIYLDSSVLMPAIVTGHPHQQAYLAAIRKLQGAAQVAGARASILFADAFVDEVIAHRKLAIDIYKDFGLEDEDTLRRRILFYGADKVNVYIGGYSWWVRLSENKDKSFHDFLAQEAPYTNKGELAAFLRKMGIAIVATVPSTSADVRRQGEALDALEKGYLSEEIDQDRAFWKYPILKKHEALQIDLLSSAMEQGRRPVFVTADLKLRRAIESSSLTGLRDVLISPQNLIQLVDLLVGIDVPPAALQRILWNVRATDEGTLIKDYLVARAVPHYDAAMLLRLNDLLSDYSERIVKEASQEKVSLVPAPSRRLTTSRFMDRVENEVFANLAIEVEKLRTVLKNATD